MEQALSNVYTMNLNAGFAENVSTRKDTLWNSSYVTKTRQVASQVGHGTVSGHIELGHGFEEDPRYDVVDLIILQQMSVETFDRLIDLVDPIREELVWDKVRLVRTAGNNPTRGGLVTFLIRVSGILICLANMSTEANDRRTILEPYLINRVTKGVL